MNKNFSNNGLSAFCTGISTVIGLKCLEIEMKFVFFILKLKKINIYVLVIMCFLMIKQSVCYQML